jgi:hypothetical protein
MVEPGAIPGRGEPPMVFTLVVTLTRKQHAAAWDSAYRV